MTVKEKREAIEEMVMEVVRLLDNDKKENIKYYEAFFKTMDDETFGKWASTMGHDLDDTIQISQLPFEECTLSQIKDAADYLNVPLEEYMWYRDKDDEPVRTAQRVPVGYIQMKRPQQMSAKKTKIATESDKRALKTGQVVGASKASGVTDLEAYMLLAIGADAIMEEFYGPRADGYDKKADFYQQITNFGSVDLDELETDLTKHTTLMTLNTYLLASGIRTDLVSKTLKTAYTIKKDMGR